MKFFKFNNSIKTRIISSFVILTFILLLTSNIIVYTNILKETKHTFLEFSKKQVDQIDTETNNYVSTIATANKLIAENPILKNISSSIVSYSDKSDPSGYIEPIIKTEDEKRLSECLEYFVKNFPMISCISVGMADNGGFLAYPSTKRANNYDPRTREWYKKAMETPDKVIFTDIYITSGGETALSSAVTIKNSNNNIIGVVVLDFNFKNLSSMINKTKIGQDGFVILTDKKGSILANPLDNSTISKKLTDLKLPDLNDFKDDPNDVKTLTVNNTKYLVSKIHSNNSLLGWNYLTFVEQNEFMSSANKIGAINLVLFVVFTILSILAAIFISNKISKPIIGVSNHIEMLGNGDFTIDLDNKYTNLKDEVGVIAHSTEKMQNSIRDILLSVKNTSLSIDDISKNLNTSADDISSSSINVSSASQETADGTTMQSTKLMDIVTIFNDFSKNIENTIEELDHINSSVIDINTKATNSNTSLETLNNSITNIKNNFKEFELKISTLNNDVIKINEIINLIDAVAEQTNLLALNAAIEAARAGDSGRGFAVVAEEIRRLAETSKSSALEITNLLGNISTSTTTIVNDAQSINSELEDQINVINTSILDFKEIVSSVTVITPKINDITQSTTIINTNKDNILNRLEETSAISEEISASSEEISAASQSVTASLEEISRLTETLTTSSKEMIDKVDLFKL